MSGRATRTSRNELRISSPERNVIHDKSSPPNKNLGSLQSSTQPSGTLSPPPAASPAVQMSRPGIASIAVSGAASASRTQTDAIAVLSRMNEDELAAILSRLSAKSPVPSHSNDPQAPRGPHPPINPVFTTPYSSEAASAGRCVSTVANSVSTTTLPASGAPTVFSISEAHKREQENRALINLHDSKIEQLRLDAVKQQTSIVDMDRQYELEIVEWNRQVVEWNGHAAERQRGLRSAREWLARCEAEINKAIWEKECALKAFSLSCENRMPRVTTPKGEVSTFPPTSPEARQSPGVLPIPSLLTPASCPISPAVAALHPNLQASRVVQRPTVCLWNTQGTGKDCVHTDPLDIRPPPTFSTAAWDPQVPQTATAVQPPRIPGFALASTPRDPVIDFELESRYAMLSIKDSKGLPSLPLRNPGNLEEFLNFRSALQQVLQSLRRAARDRSENWGLGWTDPLCIAVLHAVRDESPCAGATRTSIRCTFNSVDEELSRGVLGPEAFECLIFHFALKLGQVNLSNMSYFLSTFKVEQGTPFWAYFDRLRQVSENLVGLGPKYAPNLVLVESWIKDSMADQFPTKFSQLFKRSTAVNGIHFASLADLWAAAQPFHLDSEPAQPATRFLAHQSASPYAATPAPVTSVNLVRDAHEADEIAADQINEEWETICALGYLKPLRHKKSRRPCLFKARTVAEQRADRLRVGNICLNCAQKGHLMMSCNKLFLNTTGILNPEFGELEDSDKVWRFMQEGMKRHRRKRDFERIPRRN